MSRENELIDDLNGNYLFGLIRYYADAGKSVFKILELYTYTRVGNLYLITIFGFNVFKKAGSANWLLGIKWNL